MRWHTAALVVALGLAPGGTALAQERPNVDLFQGPVLQSARVVGLGGANVGMADGAGGLLDNPAAIAVRKRHNAYKYFHWDVVFGVGVATGGTRIELSELPATYSSSGFFRLGADFRWGPWGFGFLVRGTTYTLEVPWQDTRRSYEFQLVSGGLGAARTFADGNFTLGLALVNGDLELRETTSTDVLGVVSPVRVKLNAFGARLGGIFTPVGRPYRIGAAIQSPGVFRGETRGNTDPSREINPAGVNVPFEAAVGASVMLGEREYNKRHTYLRRAIRKQAGWEPPDFSDERWYVLFTGEMIFTGPTPFGISPLGLLSQAPEPAGDHTTIGVRGGVESEVVPDWLTLRSGSYWEPSRTAEPGRLHGTFGFDVKVPVVLDFRLGAVADLSRDFRRYGLSAGMWH